MNAGPLTKKDLKPINEALYELAKVTPLIELLKRANQDTTELEQIRDHIQMNLTAYKDHIEGRK